MKLKYMIKNNDIILLATSLKDLALYYGISISGIKYKIKNNIVDFKKINTNLHDLWNEGYHYKIDQECGVVIVDNKDSNINNEDESTSSEEDSESQEDSGSQ